MLYDEQGENGVFTMLTAPTSFRPDVDDLQGSISHATIRRVDFGGHSYAVLKSVECASKALSNVSWCESVGKFEFVSYFQTS